MGKQVTEPLGSVKSGFVQVKKATKPNPAWAWPEAFRLDSEGHGYRTVASRLADLGVWTTRGSVERLIKGLPPYQGQHPSR